MPARLFRRIQSFFSRLNKTVLLTVIMLIAGVFFIGRPIIAFAQPTTTSPWCATLTGTALSKCTALDNNSDYANLINTFTTSNNGEYISGLSGGTVQNSTSSNNAVGLVFNVTLGVNVSGPKDSIENHWINVTNKLSQAFIIELCTNGRTGQCWLNTIPTQAAADNPGQNVIAVQSGSSNTSDGQIIATTAFGTASNKNSGTTYSYNPDTNTINNVNGVILPQGATLTATLWYQSEYFTNAYNDYKNIGITTNGPVSDFGSLSNGSSNGGYYYFQIGQPLTITIPNSTAGIQQQIAASTQTLSTPATNTSSEDNNLPGCGVVWGQKGTINGCAAQLAYGIYNLTAWVAGLFGQLFDFFIGYSVSSSSYTYPFVITGWKLVRDISNIFFIIIMVWTGFSAVFDTEKTSMKKVVPALIVNALLINFSLFFTHVVIDISNITARMFYSEMIVCDKSIITQYGNCTAAHSKTSLGGYWPLSEKIVSSFNPQIIFSTKVLTPPTSNSDPSDNGASSFDATKAGVDTTNNINSRDYADFFGIVCLIAAGIMVAVAIMFFKVMFLFLGRVIGLYICMIFSPFAFLSHDIPMLGGIERLRWSDWVKELTNYALLAPIFIFFLYIIYTFLSSNFVQQIGVADKTGTFFGTVISVTVPMLIIYFMIQAAQKTAEKYAGEIGKSIQGFGEKVTGFATGTALGIATGGTALAGRNIIGRLGSRISESETLKNASASGKWYSKLADSTISTSTTLSKATYDPRNTKAIKNLQSKSGINLDNSFVRLTGAGTNKTDGGFKGAISRNEKDLNDRAERFQLRGIAAKIHDEKTKNWEDSYQTARTQAERSALQTGTVFDEVQYRANYITTQTTAGNPRPKNSEEINRDREKQYNAVLKKGTALSRISKVVTNRFTAPAGAAGASTAVITGGATALSGAGVVAAAAVIGQGAIQNEARQNVTLARAEKVKDPMSPQQQQRSEVKLTQLQQELIKTVQRLDTIGASLQPPKRYIDMSNADIIDYRNSRQASLQQIQQQITTNDNFIKTNQADPDPAMKARVAGARNSMVTDKAQEQQLNNDIRESRTVWGDYTKIQADITNVRSELKI